jgi:RHS repeat-associated protein
MGDFQKSFTRETDSNQATTATKQYDAFGMQIASTGSSVSPFGFAGGFGYQEDSDSGLKLLGHRYYDSSTGRFLTRDPIEDGRNWYSYCENNPVILLDPKGLDAWYNHLLDGDVWREGLTTSAAALGSAASEVGVGILKTSPIALACGAWKLEGWDGGSHKDDPGFGVSKFSWHVAITAVELIIGAKAGGIEGKIEIHPPHHTFGKLGKLKHIQGIIWRKGVKGSQKIIRIPLPKIRIPFLNK